MLVISKSFVHRIVEFDQSFWIPTSQFAFVFFVLSGLKKIDSEILTDTAEDSKLVHRRKRPKVDTLFSFLFFRRVRATSMTQRRVENTRVHFGANSPVSVKYLTKALIFQINFYRSLQTFLCMSIFWKWLFVFESCVASGFHPISESWRREGKFFRNRIF